MRIADRHPFYVFALGVCHGVGAGHRRPGARAASAPPVQQISQAKVVGQTGFAYLGGLARDGCGVALGWP